ncbi:glycoside hydrolase family 29 [Candidatus Poribacteria bacterium]|nr:glycoside hydrolase family 29 [Candidatus Poribacteria bacterium]
MAEDIRPMDVLPTKQQIEYQQMELIGFIHYTVNAFTDKEWGDGTESPSIFNPSKLDTSQWARVAKKAGMGLLIITAKHHDGFCLWPSKYTDHSVKSSPWKDGKGDILAELSRSCAEMGLKMGIYLSPWDRHEPKYGTDEYNQYYLNQLEELLTNYDKISEIWMDGAKGPDAKDMEYDFQAYRTLIRKLQPDALIFSDAGPDIRWIGNESGIAGETNWSTINNDEITIGKADTKYLNSGDPDGKRWVTGECDVSIRPGWFYHPAEDDKVKTPQQLIDIYYKSVGRNGVLLLNIPPDRRGLFHENDIASLKEFRQILDETFKTDLASEGTVKASNYRQTHPKFSPSNVLDASSETYWATDDSIIESYIEITLKQVSYFDTVMIQEPIRFGQRISTFAIEACLDNQWKQIAEGTTIGYKRLLRVSPVRTDCLRVLIKESKDIPAISNISIYKSSPGEGR